MQTIHNTYTRWISAAGKVSVVSIHDLIVSGIPMEDEDELALDTEELVDECGSIGIHPIVVQPDRIDEVELDIATSEDRVRVGLDLYGCGRLMFQTLHYVPTNEDPQVTVRYLSDCSIAEVVVTPGIPVFTPGQWDTPWLLKRDAEPKSDPGEMTP